MGMGCTVSSYLPLATFIAEYHGYTYYSQIVANFPFKSDFTARRFRPEERMHLWLHMSQLDFHLSSDYYKIGSDMLNSTLLRPLMNLFNLLSYQRLVIRLKNCFVLFNLIWRPVFAVVWSVLCNCQRWGYSWFMIRCSGLICAPIECNKRSILSHSWK